MSYAALRQRLVDGGGADLALTDDPLDHRLSARLHPTCLTLYLGDLVRCGRQVATLRPRSVTFDDLAGTNSGYLTRALSLVLHPLVVDCDYHGYWAAHGSLPACDIDGYPRHNPVTGEDLLSRRAIRLQPGTSVPPSGPRALRRYRRGTSEVGWRIGAYLAGFEWTAVKAALLAPEARCWLCLPGPDGRLLGDEASAHPHLWRHVDEREYPPGLLAAAYKEAAYPDPVLLLHQFAYDPVINLTDHDRMVLYTYLAKRLPELRRKAATP